MDIEEYNAYKLYFLEKDALRGQLKERKRPGLSEKCFEMIKNTMHHSFNMVHHRVNRGVEGVQVLTKIFNQLFHDKAHAVYVYSDNLQLEVICFSRNFLLYFPFCLVVFIFGSKYK